ncbi:MAG: helical backbone metal receptor [Bacteroidota bacterium]|nr:helical backbone metal receptor [Bacteroidota bacterium]
MEKRMVIDQMDFEVSIPQFPKRIISLVPSQTELLYDLGMEDRVVGITRFCIHPRSWFQSKQRVGGTKDFSIERIRILEPDLIIGNKEENHKEGIGLLQKEFPVWMSDITRFPEALDMIRRIGDIVDRPHEGEKMVQSILHSMSELPVLTPNLKAAYIIWKDPWMFAGRNTFIDSMMENLFFLNVFDIGDTRYPQMDLQELKKRNPEIILLSTEPFPFKERDLEEVKKSLPDAKIILVDGEFFSWYGSRLLKASNYFSKLIGDLQHP